ncbi:diacylglycerol kinase family lipid kinase [bacterium]|nr:MAG: diacylglycerol kinase family lipid kinase [bacterium]
MPTDHAPDARIVVILNPGSGSSDEGLRDTLEKALRDGGADYEIRETTKERDGAVLAKEAREEGVRQVMACGGDGTVMAVINGLGANDEESPAVTLSIVPGGTANLIAAALGVPTDPEEAVKVALEGEERDVDLGRRDETLFALGIGVGLTERLVSEASTEAKEKIGRWAYLFAMLKEIGAKPNRFELQLDGGETIRDHGVAMVIANSGELGHGMRFAPDAKLDDGKLDVCILRHFGIGDVFRLGVRTLTGGLREDRALTFHQAHRVEFKADPPLEVQIDGEPVEAKTPIVAEAIPKALRVRVPQTERNS